MDSFDSIPFGRHAAPGQYTFLRLLTSCVADLTAGELLGMILAGVFVGERQTRLKRHSSDMANGFYQRKVSVGGLPTPDSSDPRTRTGDFRPAIPPGPRPSLGRGRDAQPGTGRPAPGNALDS